MRATSRINRSPCAVLSASRCAHSGFSTCQRGRVAIIRTTANLSSIAGGEGCVEGIGEKIPPPLSNIYIYIYRGNWSLRIERTPPVARP